MSKQELECPCCGNVGAESDDDGFFCDGHGLICGCDGQVVVDSETSPYVDAAYCDCEGMGS